MKIICRRLLVDKIQMYCEEPLADADGFYYCKNESFRLARFV